MKSSNSFLGFIKEIINEHNRYTLRSFYPLYIIPMSETTYLRDENRVRSINNFKRSHVDKYNFYSGQTVKKFEF